MAEYVKIESGKIIEYISTNRQPEGKGWRKVDGKKFNGAVGMPESWIDWDKSELKPEEKLISEGLIVDNRGKVIYEKSSGRPFEIKALNFEILDTFTDQKPNSRFDEWDGSKWVENVQAREEFEKQVQIVEARGFLNDTADDAAEAMESGTPLIESDPELYQKRKAARETIKALTA